MRINQDVFKGFIYFRERGKINMHRWKIGAEAKRERESPADSLLGVENDVGLDLPMQRS